MRFQQTELIIKSSDLTPFEYSKAQNKQFYSRVFTRKIAQSKICPTSCINWDLSCWWVPKHPKRKCMFCRVLFPWKLNLNLNWTHAIICVLMLVYTLDGKWNLIWNKIYEYLWSNSGLAAEIVSKYSLIDIFLRRENSEKKKLRTPFENWFTFIDKCCDICV